MDHQHDKKQFNYPKKQDVIDQIKALDDEIEHVSLNLIKCNFEATEKDVEKAFPEYKFIKVKNYNPGSFQVIFQMKIDAINFVRNCFDRKILNRRFFIKMGRQHKQVLEDWACVGFVPKKFAKNDNHYKGGKGGQGKTNHHPREEHGKGQQKNQKTQKQQNKQLPVQKQQKKVVQQVKKQQTQVKPETAPKKGIHIPTTQYHNKGQKTHQKHHQKQHQKKQNPKNQASKTQGEPKKVQTNNEANKKTDAKKDEKNEKKTEKAQKKTEGKKEQKEKTKQEVKPKQQKKVEEDDGWITVPTKSKKR